MHIFRENIHHHPKPSSLFPVYDYMGEQGMGNFQCNTKSLLILISWSKMKIFFIWMIIMLQPCCQMSVQGT